MWFCDVIQILNLYDKLSLLRPDKSVRDYLPRPFAVAGQHFSGAVSRKVKQLFWCAGSSSDPYAQIRIKQCVSHRAAPPARFSGGGVPGKNTLRKPEAHAETDGAKYAVTALAVIAGLFTGRELNG